MAEETKILEGDCDSVILLCKGKKYLVKFLGTLATIEEIEDGVQKVR